MIKNELDRVVFRESFNGSITEAAADQENIINPGIYGWKVSTIEEVLFIYQSECIVGEDHNIKKRDNDTSIIY